MGRPEKYGVTGGPLLLFTSPKSSDVCSENSVCHIWTDRSPWFSVGYSQEVPRNKSA